MKRASTRSSRRRRAPNPIAWGLTLDTGALVAFERADRNLVARLKEALAWGRRITLPAVVITEAWRGGDRSARLAPLIESCVVEALAEPLARRAGEMLGQVPGATPIDAIVAVSAAQRGDVVVTSDVADLTTLASHLVGVGVAVV